MVFPSAPSGSFDQISKAVYIVSEDFEEYSQATIIFLGIPSVHSNVQATSEIWDFHIPAHSLIERHSLSGDAPINLFVDSKDGHEGRCWK